MNVQGLENQERAIEILRPQIDCESQHRSQTQTYKSTFSLRRVWIIGVFRRFSFIWHTGLITKTRESSKAERHFVSMVKPPNTTMANSQFDGADPMLVLIFLTAFNRETNNNEISEYMANLVLLYFPTGNEIIAYDCGLYFAAIDSSLVGIKSWPGCIQLLLCSFAKAEKNHDLVHELRSPRQKEVRLSNLSKIMFVSSLLGLTESTRKKNEFHYISKSVYAALRCVLHETGNFSGNGLRPWTPWSKLPCPMDL